MPNEFEKQNKTDNDFAFHTCTTCGEEKPVSDFYKEARNIKGIRNTCKTCFIKARCTPENLAKSKVYNKKRREADPRMYLYYAAKNRAKKSGVPFTITLDDIFIPKTCPVFGVVLEHGKGGHQDNSPSLDRMHPKFGYVPGNVKVICDRANRIKKDATLEEIESLVRFLTSFKRINLGNRATNVQVNVSVALTKKEHNA